MIFAIPIKSKNTNAPISRRFARSPFYAIFYSTTKEVFYIDNNYFGDNFSVADNVCWLLSKHNVDKYVGYEFGLKLQNNANHSKVQLIIINQHIKKLKDLVNLMNAHN
mgnify:CR=1 FL=1|jgi:predicted Fe-Mo cluster-binding NifX family protein